MKPIIVFFSLMFPALFLGYNNYAEAKENIIKDVNQALAKTVSDGIISDLMFVEE